MAGVANGVVRVDDVAVDSCSDSSLNWSELGTTQEAACL